MAVSNLDRVNASKRAGGQINVGKTNSVITDAMVSTNSASLSALRADVISAGLVGRPDNYPIAVKVAQALDIYKDLSIVQENHGLSNVAALVSASDVDSTSRRIGIWS